MPRNRNCAHRNRPHPEKNGYRTVDQWNPNTTVNIRLRIRLLWIGLATYLIIVLNDIRYVRSDPGYVVVLAALINGGIIFALIYGLRKSYKKLRENTSDNRDPNRL
jgi:hypothetical protein